MTTLPTSAAPRTSSGLGLAYGAFALLGLIWGSNFIFVKWAAVSISPSQIVLLRVLFGFLPLLVAALAIGALHWRDARHAHHLLVMSVLATTFYYVAAEVDYGTHPGAETPRTGQLFIVIDPARGATRAYAERARALIDAVRSSGAARLPSDRRYENRERSQRVGIPVKTSDLDRIAKLEN